MNKFFLAAAAAVAPLTFAGAPAMADGYGGPTTTCSDNAEVITATESYGDGYEYSYDYCVAKPKAGTTTNNVDESNNSSSSSNNSINIQQAPQAVVAPRAPRTAPGQVGDVVVPLPTVGVSAFGSRDANVFGGDSIRDTYGVQAGFSIPLGTGQTRRAADQVIARRDAEMRFQLIQEATYMLQAGVLSEEVYPEHWAALYGTPVETVSFEAE